MFKLYSNLFDFVTKRNRRLNRPSVFLLLAINMHHGIDNGFDKYLGTLLIIF
jgi:hypothetical protein